MPAFAAAEPAAAPDPEVPPLFEVALGPRALVSISSSSSRAWFVPSFAAAAPAAAPCPAVPPLLEVVLGPNVGERVSVLKKC